MPKKRSYKRKPCRKHKRRQSSLTKATTNMTKIAVTGLVGAGIIATTGAALRNLTR